MGTGHGDATGGMAPQNFRPIEIPSRWATRRGIFAALLGDHKFVISAIGVQRA